MNEHSDVQEIRRLLDERVTAIEKQDASAACAAYAPDVVIFDVIGPLQHSGATAVRDRLTQWFATFDGPVLYEITDLVIEAHSGVGFCHSFNRVQTHTKAGTMLDMYWRETLGWQQINERWMITHAHSSVPFDVETGMASVGLKPFLSPTL